MKKGFKSSASSTRVASSLGGFGTFATATSSLSYLTEPPDLSQITDSHVIVALKNLSKKDSITKAKALEELLGSLKDSSDFAVLTAWSDLYPRTSIDNSQVVRRSAHILQGILTVNAGKTIVPLLPKLIASWLAGLYDGDKSVAKAASDALDRSFTSPEKRTRLWAVYKDSIYERVEDSLITQTANTLSDERTTSPDEAENKYVRVTGTAMRLLEQLITVGLDKPEILQNKHLWQFVYHNDAYLRNGSCNLLLVVLSKHSEELDWNFVSESFIFQGLKRNQTGSVRAYLTALIELTRVRPSVWTIDYTAKTTASKRLLQFVRNGSQSGPQQTWELSSDLLRLVPSDIWRKNIEDIDHLLEAFRAGIFIERVHIDAAWQSYIALCFWTSERLVDEEKASFSEKNLLPIVVSYMAKDPNKTWKVGGRAEQTAVSACVVTSNISPSALQKTWVTIVDDTIEKMRLSLPESSKDFHTSQDAVSTHGRRLLHLEEAVKVSASDDKQRALFQSIVKPLNQFILHAAIDLLRSRKGKPYGAASIIEALTHEEAFEDDELKSFLLSDLEDLLESPSCEQLVSIALLTNRSIASRLLTIPTQSSYTIRGTEYFLRHASEQQLRDITADTAIMNSVGDFEAATERKYALAILQNRNLSQTGLKSKILLLVTTNLGIPDKQESSLDVIESILSQRILADELCQSESGALVSSKLLLLADSNSFLADRASNLNGRLTSTTNGSVGTLSIIKQQLRGEGVPLSILTVTDLGLNSIGEHKFEDLLPDLNDWERALMPYLGMATNSNLAITSPLQGAVWAVTQLKPTSSSETIRDSEDFSLLFRITFYVTKLGISKVALEHAKGEQMEAFYAYYPVALQLVNEKITLDDANEIWLGSTNEVLQAAADVLSEGAQILHALQSDENYIKFWIAQGLKLGGFSREMYLNSLAFLSVMNDLLDRAPKAILQDFETEILASHKSQNLLQSATLLCAAGESLTMSPNGSKLINELIASITQSPSRFDQIVLLNILLKTSPGTLEQLPQQRLVFLFKKLVTQAGESVAMGLLSETLRLVAIVIPYVQEVYGEHWEQLVSDLVEVWSNFSSTDVAGIYSSLLVHASLKRALKAETANEDLQEAFSQNKTGLDAGILHCLQNLNIVTENIDQPRTITAELLRRLLDGVKVLENTDLYALLASTQKPVRRAAYDLLHRSIPEKQEQLSYDLILDNKISQLPQELLHLISDTEDMDRYLLSWLVVFDHYPKASYKLREAYNANIKEGNQIDSLLEVICEKMRISSNRPLDASKFDVTDFDPESAESTNQQLVVHLYYLCLLYLPGLVKNWHLEQKNRIKMPLEAWTQKYLSPHIIAAAIDSVAIWSGQQSSESDDRKLEIRASPRSGEIIASIAVDPESPSISLAVTLPTAYPLESPAVISRSRVGVSEKNWTSWLRTFQIIIFSTGSIIEGLIAFKRNVSLALTGHSECAICYSIIGQDMQTPNKKCGTCKNMFHGVCLFRWFRSSNSSSCPLCRNNFNYA